MLHEKNEFFEAFQDFKLQRKNARVNLILFLQNLKQK